MPYFTTADGCRLFYETCGLKSTEPVVVFLHGTMQTSLYWRPQCLFFQKRFRVLTYDVRAHGKSDLGMEKLSLEVHAADLDALLRHLGIDKAHLIGLSHGARIAWAYGANEPGRIGRLVLCSLGTPDSCRSKLFVRSWLDTLRGSGLAAMARALLPVVFGELFLIQKERILPSIVNATVKRNSKEGIIAHLEAMKAYPALSQTAGRVPVPTLVISGSDDPLVSEQGASKLASLCQARHEHLIGVGHSVASEAPERFNKIVFEFLDKRE